MVSKKLGDKQYAKQIVLHPDSKIELVFGSNSSMSVINKPDKTETEITKLLDIVEISGQSSTINGNKTGSTTGSHFYNLSGYKRSIKIDESTPLTINIGNNVQLVNDNDYEKTDDKNTWSGSIYSDEYFDPFVEDFAVSVLVEEISGTVREMIGLDDAPEIKDSYTTMEYAIYQVNSSFYYTVYEDGFGIPTGAGNITLKVGDRIGIKCIDQKIYYFILSGGVETIVYESTKPPKSNKLFFKAALNREPGSSGHSVISEPAFHKTPILKYFNTNLLGASSEIVSSEDIKKVELATGLLIDESSTYSKLILRRIQSEKYNELPIQVIHNYYGVTDQTINTIEFQGE